MTVVTFNVTVFNTHTHTIARHHPWCHWPLASVCVCRSHLTAFDWYWLLLSAFECLCVLLAVRKAVKSNQQQSIMLRSNHTRAHAALHAHYMAFRRLMLNSWLLLIAFYCVTVVFDWFKLLVAAFECSWLLPIARQVLKATHINHKQSKAINCTQKPKQAIISNQPQTLKSQKHSKTVKSNPSQLT